MSWRIIFSLVTVYCLLVTPNSAHAGLVIDDFEQYTAGRFPSSWRTWPGQRAKAAKVYTVKSEGNNKYLSASDSEEISVQAMRHLSWKINSYPILSWRWRAKTLPKGANETSRATNDSACGIYIIFSRGRGEMLKYTWSTTAPAGTIYEKKQGKAFITALDSGTARLGRWQRHEINVPEEYKKHFHKELNRNPPAIAVLTDGNATHSPSSCDYDDFTIREAD